MSEIEIRIADRPVAVPDGTTVEWLDHRRGIARVRLPGRSVEVLVEGGPGAWFAVVDGRRLAVEIRTARERLLAEAGGGPVAGRGPARITASLPGLVREVTVEIGAMVAAGERLLVLEAMKMQNEIRAPRAGVVTEITVRAGETVAAGALLLQIGDRAAVQSPPDERAHLP